MLCHHPYCLSSQSQTLFGIGLRGDVLQPEVRPFTFSSQTGKTVDTCNISVTFIFDTTNHSKDQDNYHPRRPRGGHSGREKRRDESFQAQAEKPLGTDSHRTISKRSSECWLLIGHKRCFVLLCPIGKQFLVSSFREFVYDGYFLAAVAPFVHQASLTRNEESTEESINVSDAISGSNSICTEKILFLTDHNVS